MGLLIFLFLLTCGQSEQHIIKVSSMRPADIITIGRPIRQGTWPVKPSLRICDDTKVSMLRAQRALRFWESLGYDFDGIFTDSSPSCMNPRYGEIIVTLPEGGFADWHMASTRTYTTIGTDDIVKAKIHILPIYARKERVLEHEIGHALGWKHYNKKFHIMNSIWQNGGYGHFGLRE